MRFDGEFMLSSPRRNTMVATERTLVRNVSGVATNSMCEYVLPFVESWLSYSNFSTSKVKNL